MSGLQPVSHGPPHLGTLVAPHDLVLGLIAEVDAAYLVPLLLQPVHDACAQPALVDADQRGLELLYGVDDVAGHFHRVCAAVPPQLQDVASLPYGDDGGVRPKACRVYSYDDGRAVILDGWPLHGVIDQSAADKLVVTFAGEVAVHLDGGLVAVRPVLVDNALVEVLVRPLDIAGVNDACGPERPLAVKRLVEIPRVAARVGESQMEPIWCVFSKETIRYGPDAVGDTAGFVEDQHDAVEVVDTCVGVGVLFGPQPAFDRPVARAFLEVALNQFG